MKRSLFPLVLAAALVLAACGSDQPVVAPAPGMGEMTEHVDDMPGDMHGGGGHGAAEEAPETVGGAPEVQVVATDLAFAPTRLALVAGEPLNVTVTNEGTIFHDFTLEEAGVHLNLDPGEQASTALVIEEPGTYEATCTVPGHAEAGMVVTVEVT